MKRVAVFGNAGAGKSTLARARALAQRKQLSLHGLDQMVFKPGGGLVPHEVFLQHHREVLAQETWVMDGYGSMDTLWPRLDAADTLVYLDLPLPLHFWWVTKRLLKSLVMGTPEGWPTGAPMWRGTLSAWRVLWLCHRHLTPKYRAYVAAAASTRAVHHLQSKAQIRDFLRRLQPFPPPRQ